MLSALAYALCGIIELLVGLRFFFRLMGARTSSQLVVWVYHWSEPLVAPFNGIFGQHPVIAAPGTIVHGTLDWTSLLALIVYATIGGIISRLVGAIGV